MNLKNVTKPCIAKFICSLNEVKKVNKLFMPGIGFISKIWIKGLLFNKQFYLSYQLGWSKYSKLFQNKNLSVILLVDIED